MTYEKEQKIKNSHPFIYDLEGKDKTTMKHQAHLEKLYLKEIFSVNYPAQNSRI